MTHICSTIYRIVMEGIKHVFYINVALNKIIIYYNQKMNQLHKTFIGINVYEVTLT